jgi:penicillin-binding protein 1A
MPKVIATARRFGVTSDLPNFLPVAIGAADLTLSEQVGAYMVFPNDGIRIEPHLIRKLVQADGLPLKEHVPVVTEVISVDTARTMMVMLKAVLQYGTGAAASSLGHPLGGKTGTTNNYTDAWFIGFSPSVTCGTWMGFDGRESLGKRETGARAALPMWIDFMRVADANKPKEQFATTMVPKKAVNATTEGPKLPSLRPAGMIDANAGDGSSAPR